MTTSKIDAIETASNAIQTSHGGVLLPSLSRALATMMDGEANALCGAEYGQRSGGAWKASGTTLGRLFERSPGRRLWHPAGAHRPATRRAPCPVRPRKSPPAAVKPPSAPRVTPLEGDRRAGRY
jgi:hypothetical protein